MPATTTRPATRYYAAAYPLGTAHPLRVLRVFGSVLGRSIWLAEGRNRRTVAACDVTRSERACLAELERA